MTSLRLTLASGALAIALAACGSDGNGNPVLDGGGVCTPAASSTAARAVTLTLDQAYPSVENGDPNSTCIFMLRQQLWFKVEVPADKPIFSVDVAFPNGTRSKINLEYEIFAEADALSPPDGGPRATGKPVTDPLETVHASHVTRSHYLPGGGTYYVMVHDASDDAKDENNVFSITVSASVDPDPNEGHNDCQNAVAVGSGQQGYLAYEGDVDAFKVNVPAGGHIIDLVLDTLNQPSTVRPRMTLYAPDGTIVSEDSNPAGGAINIHARRAVVGAGGDYCVLVRDYDDTMSDPLHAYHIAATVLAEPDENEQTTRNDIPQSATNIGTGGSSEGYIASTGDADWYALHQTVGQLIDVHVQGVSGSAVKLAMTLVYPDPTKKTPCTVGSTDTCQYLTNDTACTAENAVTTCESHVCQKNKCAIPCELDVDCPGHACSAGACAGAGVCLATATGGQCGVTQYIKGPNSSNDVQTVQPALADVTYVLVHDASSPAAFDDTAPYSITFAQHAELDTGEPDNHYDPFLDLDTPETHPEDVLAKSFEHARTLTAGVTATGYISYEGDIDAFKFNNPCGAQADAQFCTLAVTFSIPAAGLSTVDYIYMGYGGPYDEKYSFRASTQPDTIFGNGGCGSNECAYMAGGGDNSAYILVRDFGHKTWDYQHAYTIKVEGTADCNGACKPYGVTDCAVCE
jgi:hypothetical protein